MDFWKTKNKLEAKSDFHRKIGKYYFELAGEIIPVLLVEKIINKITDSQYNNYERFWKQYPKSRKRYSELKIEDLEHPFTHHEVTHILKQEEDANYKIFSKILLKMNDEEFDRYESYRYQYENK